MCILLLRDNCLFCSNVRMHIISWQFIPLIYGSLWENEYFLISYLLCPFTSVKSCSLVLLPVLILKNPIWCRFFQNDIASSPMSLSSYGSSWTNLWRASLVTLPATNRRTSRPATRRTCPFRSTSASLIATLRYFELNWIEFISSTSTILNDN